MASNPLLLQIQAGKSAKEPIRAKSGRAEQKGANSRNRPRAWGRRLSPGEQGYGNDDTNDNNGSTKRTHVDINWCIAKKAVDKTELIATKASGKQIEYTIYAGNEAELRVS